MDIREGRRYRCIRDVRLGGIGEIVYIKDKIYKSEVNRCITDETGNKLHLWTSAKITSETFIPVSNKRKYYYEDKERET